jgi:hypothetical protein
MLNPGLSCKRKKKMRFTSKPDFGFRKEYIKLLVLEDRCNGAETRTLLKID